MAKWRNSVQIKDMFTNEESDTTVLEICNALIPQLEVIYNRERKILEDNCIDSEFEEVIDNFKFIKHCIENKEDSSEYEFESWTEAFDGYLNQLYDLGDITIARRNWHNDEKLLWVG